MAHLRNDETIRVPGYKWIGQNRQKYKRPSGGIGFLISLKLYSLYYVKILDTSLEGIIVLSLYHRHSGFCTILAGVYIPPKSSPCGYSCEK